MLCFRRTVRGLVWAMALAPGLRAATLPEHEPLGVLVVSDEVNPHGLSDDELTQPGDISAALNASDSGINLREGGAVEVSSQCDDDALAAFAADPPPDVLVYFAHRPAQACGGGNQQAAVTSAVDGLLASGGGVVVFHHGSYQDPGKTEILALLGVSAGSIAWDTTTGQRVYAVAPGHFVTTNGLSYEGSAAFAGITGVPAGSYEYFDNIPDERYPATMLLTEPDEQRTILFASDSGTPRVLGYALERPGWGGRVVMYQPGEWQPHALDDRAGPNFQILANAIVYAAHAETGAPGGGTGGEAGASGGEPGTSGSSGAEAGSGGGGSGGVAGMSGRAGASGSGGSSGSGGASSAGRAGSSSASGGTASGSGGTSAGATTGGTSSVAGGAAGSVGGTPGSAGQAPANPSDGAKDDSGCGCRTAGGRSSGSGWLVALLLFGIYRATRSSSRRCASVFCQPST